MNSDLDPQVAVGGTVRPRIGPAYWRTDVWVLPDLDTFLSELRSALGPRLDTLIRPAVIWLNRHGHEDETAGNEPLATALIELAAAIDPVVGSRQVSDRAARMLAGLIGVVAGNVTGGMPLLWRDAHIPVPVMALTGDELLGLTVTGGTHSFRVVPTVDPDSLEQLVEKVGWTTITNLMAVGEWVDRGSGDGGMILVGRLSH